MWILHEYEIDRKTSIRNFWYGKVFNSWKIYWNLLSMLHSTDAVVFVANRQKDLISEKEYQYLYNEGDTFIFMDQSSFEQIDVGKDVLQGTECWLQGEEVCKMLFWNGEVLKMEPPTFVEIEINSTEPGLKGDTVSNTLKPATLTTGKEINVPLFINEGDIIKIDTRDGSYVGRANK